MVEKVSLSHPPAEEGASRTVDSFYPGGAHSCFLETGLQVCFPPREIGHACEEESGILPASLSSPRRLVVNEMLGREYDEKERQTLTSLSQYVHRAGMGASLSLRRLNVFKQ